MSFLQYTYSTVKGTYTALSSGILPRKFALHYLRSRLRPALAVGKSGAGTADLLGYRIHFFDAQNFFILLNEVFVYPSYYFEAETERPFILDCGANIGMATLFFKAVYPGAEILAFEPDPTTFSLLQRNVVENRLAGVTPINRAVHDSTGALDFFLDRASPGDLRMSTLAGRHNRDVITVEAVRLSSYIERPVDLLKLDVEGAEGAVLQELYGSGKLAMVKKLVVECHHNVPDGEDRLQRTLELLTRSGFRYQLAARLPLPIQEELQQDVLVFAYRR